MDHSRQQYPFLSNSHDLFSAKDIERRHSLYQLSSDQRHHSFALPHQLAFQHPFSHQHMPTHMSQMMPQHFTQDFSYGMGYDHMSHGLMEHDDSNEPTTRPRLTKEQVDFFEREFAANSKPPSTYKRALALQTNIDYNRISNWFQNRRAKAKQQKKQEEFEKSQRKQKDENDETTPQPNADDDDDEEDEEEDHHDNLSKKSGSPTLDRKDRSQNTSVGDESTSLNHSKASSVASQASSPTRGSESAKEKSWASLQRALAAARAASSAQQQQQQLEQQQASFRNQPLQLMLPPRVPSRSPLSDRSSHNRLQIPGSQPSVMMSVPSQAHAVSESHSDRFGWQHQPVTSSAWPPSNLNASEMNFDFGFSQMGSSNADESVDLVSPTDTRSSNVLLSTDDWNSSLVTPTIASSAQMAYTQSMHSPGISLPVYEQSRRGSLADGLSANFESFGVDAESPDLDGSPTLSSTSGNEYDPNRTDLAARRRRPVPALAIRSHSYGAPTDKSPTCRPGVTPPQTHSLRHSKSAGHGLSTYAGVRKSSIATKSPLGLAFDSNNLDRLMAQSNGDINLRQPLMPVSNNTASTRHLHDQMMASFQALAQNRMHMGEISRHRSIQTPPITPFQLGFDSHPPTIIPPTTQGQYANCNETPPFSAGPRTASSCQWSDAGVTSPDMQHFPPVYCLPSYPYIQGDEQSGLHSIFSADQNHDLSMGLSADKKQPEWFSHTFDGQDTVYAQIAQQIGNKGPKEYTFDNSSLSSFRGKSQSH